MEGKCLNCGTVFKIDASKIPDKGVYARCTKCQTRLFLIMHQGQLKIATTSESDTSVKNKERSLGWIWLLAAFFIPVAIGVVTCPEEYKREFSRKQPARSAVVNNAWNSGVQQVTDYLKRNLKDPKSLDVIEWSPVEKRSDGGYQVRCKYRAKNSFGGYVISNQVFIMDSNGNVLTVYDY